MMLWTFGKDQERISLGRRSGSCVLVVVRARDEVREYRFADVAALRIFQTDMEGFLMRTGWTQLKYFPERRRDRDRRRVPRTADRRKWWNGTKDRAKVVACVILTLLQCNLG
jgi:hypothetical protein